MLTKILPKANPKLAVLLLRLGLAFVFAYAAVDSLLHPDSWVGYMPQVATNIISTELLLKVISVYELALAGWLLVGKYSRYAALACIFTLVGIIGANLDALIITFRDIGLVFAAVALFFAAQE